MGFSIPFHPLRYPLHTLRYWLVQPVFWAFFFLSPLLHVFQMDVINQRVVAWGCVYPMNAHTLMWLPIGFFACVLLIAITSTMGGRLFCGWVCPHNTLAERTREIRTWIGLGKPSYRQSRLVERLPWIRVVLILASLAWATALGFTLSVLFLLYFVPLEWYLGQVSAGTLPVVIWFGQGLFTIIGLFMVYAGHDFCRNACPYGLAQSLSAYLSAKWSPMEILYKPGTDKSACGGCRACQSACPVDIDPRQPENLLVGIGEGCFNCGDCIDACSYVRGSRTLTGLLAFQRPSRRSGVFHREISE